VAATFVLIEQGASGGYYTHSFGLCDSSLRPVSRSKEEASKYPGPSGNGAGQAGSYSKRIASQHGQYPRSRLSVVVDAYDENAKKLSCITNSPACPVRLENYSWQ
jgi:hypothetical protein